MRNFSRQCLANFGWNINLAGVIPRKTIMTAAGQREAHAFFMPSDGGNELLCARHMSDGVNILESVSVHIPAGSSDDFIRVSIERFVHDAEATVCEHYAIDQSASNPSKNRVRMRP